MGQLASQPERSRAFLYGESLFTTLRVESGRLCFGDAHRQRLLEGAEWLWPGTAKQFEKLWPATAPGTAGVWRLTLSAQALTRGARLEGEPQLLMDDWWSAGLPAKETLKVRTVKTVPRSPEWPSFLKTGDYLTRLVAARHVPPHEIPLYFVADEVCEFLHANVFFWEGSKLVTPPAGPNVLAGIGRWRLIELAQKHHVEVVERNVALSEVKNFTHLWATNAVRGIIEVESIDGAQKLRHPFYEEFQRAFFFK